MSASENSDPMPAPSFNYFETCFDERFFRITPGACRIDADGGVHASAVGCSSALNQDEKHAPAIGGQVGSDVMLSGHRTPSDNGNRDGDDDSSAREEDGITARAIRMARDCTVIVGLHPGT